MAVLQHYYTSYTNQETGSTGFQVKAMSPGISPDAQSMIMRLISYTIPSSLDAHQLNTHPIALRYYYRNPQESILLCSQSNGPDENGRPGNFFAHSVVMDTSLFSSIPPILYWKSPFWRKNDPENRTNVLSLPVREEFDAEPPLDLDSMWHFLATPKRQALLYKLLCAVVHHNKTQRRIIIIDKIEHVVYWIAAVSCLLPPSYRPLLSFATYHHDPYQTPSLITGVSPDSSFRTSVEDHISYFILDGQTGNTSEIEDSPYAHIAANSAQPELYETRLLPLFTNYLDHFPAPTVIDESLDLLALYAYLQQQQQKVELSSDEIRAIEIVLTFFEHLDDYTQEHIDELANLQPIIWQAYVQQSDPTLYIAHERVVVLLKKHKVPTDTLIQTQIQHFTKQLFLPGKQKEAVTRLQDLSNSYGEDIITAHINRPLYIKWLIPVLQKQDAQHQRDFWFYIGQYITLGDHSAPLFINLISFVNTLYRDQRYAEEQVLLNAFWSAAQGREQEWLQLAVKHYQRLPQDGIIKEVYYTFVQKLPLVQRVPYRKIIQQVKNSILKYEIECDILRDIEHASRTLEDWCDHAQQLGYNKTEVTTYGLSKLKVQCTEQQWYNLAPQLLLNEQIRPLSKEIEGELVRLAFASASLSQCTPVQNKLYKQYQYHAALSPQQNTIIQTLLSINKGDMSSDLAPEIHNYVGTLSSEQYHAAIQYCLPAFFQQRITPEAHFYFVYAFFSTRKGANAYESFCVLYWQTVLAMLTHPMRKEQGLELLSLWFKKPKFPMSYTVPIFLLHLPAALEKMPRDRFQDTANIFHTLASQQPWYSAMQELFSERKSVLAALGQHSLGLMSQMAQTAKNRFRPGQAEKEADIEERKAQDVETVVASLFDKKHSLERHRHITEVYTESLREQFWNAYWKKFVNTLLSPDTNFTLALLSFWFDESFVVLENGPYIAQAFMLGLPETLQQARKERSYRDGVGRIEDKARQRKSEQWYPFMRRFLLV